jgi:hypothetical protein
LWDVALISSLGWIQFRSVIDLGKTPRLVAAAERWSVRPSVLATAPR